MLDQTRAERLSYRETMANNEDTLDLSELLSSRERDFLIRNNNEQIPVSSLVGKIVGLYFSGSWLYACKFFNAKLAEIYGKLGSTESNKFEVVYISSHESERTFSKYYAKMPWLAIPFSDSETRDRLNELFMVSGIPKLVILGANGKVTTYEGKKIVLEYGEQGFPFTSDRIRIVKEIEANKWQRLSSIFGSNYLLITNKDNQVTVNSLVGKIVGLYFAGSSDYACQCFTPILMKFYQELRLDTKDFEVVYISSDETKESVTEYCTTMPWLSIPLSDSETRQRLKEIFNIMGGSPLMKETRVPKLVIFYAEGKLTTDEGKEIVLKYGRDCYPFTSERINSLNQIKQNQTLTSIFVTGDFFISNKGEKVPVSELEEKTVCLYFCNQPQCHRFEALLLETHQKLTEMGMAFEVVLISQDRLETQFKEEGLPWLTLSDNNSAERLAVDFKVQSFPGLVIIGPDGKTLIPDAVDLIKQYGSSAYPFTPMHIAKLDKQLREQQTLKFLLVSEDRDFVIGKNGSIKKVSELDGKDILLFFSAKYTESREQFLPDMLAIYTDLEKEIEVIYISCDIDEKSFDDFYDEMPWLALPYGDEKQKFLLRWFGIEMLPQVIVVGRTGRTVTTECREMLKYHSTTAYPFHEDYMENMWATRDLVMNERPKTQKSDKHQEHDLELMYRADEYVCSDCSQYNFGWMYYCKVCNLSFNPRCIRLFYFDAAREARVEEILENQGNDREENNNEEDEARVEEIPEDQGNDHEENNNEEEEGRVEEILENQGNDHEENNNEQEIDFISLLRRLLAIFLGGCI